MHYLVDLLQAIKDPNKLLEMVRGLMESPLGLLGLCLIVFSETGLLVGFFLPGDSLLFSIGVASGASGVNIFLLAGLLMIAVICGDNLGYFLGRETGPKIFSRPKSRLFNPDHIDRTKKFYEKYGARAVVYARFIPIVRTFTPFISGVAQMPYPRFLAFSVFGGVLWIAFMTTLGYKLGQIEAVRHNFEKVIIAVIVLSLVPVLLEARKKRTA